MTLVVEIKGTGGGPAVLWVVAHATHKVDLVGNTGCDKVVPERGSPAGDLSDGVAEGHWFD